VNLPTFRAATWSTETPARMFAPSVFKGWVPVKNEASERAWSPAPSPFDLPFSCARPVRTSSSSLTAARGSRVGGSVPRGPASAGVQAGMWMPLGT
jgi:hypothetical protein